MRYIIKLFCVILKIIEEIIMKLIPQFCHEDGDVHLPRLCEHMDRFIGADDVTIVQGTPFDPLEGVIAVDEYGRVIPFTVSPSELENPCEVGVHKFVYMTENYLDERTDDNDALFVTLLAPYNRLQISGVEIRLRQLGRELNIHKVHPHKFRRTLATMAIDKGMPIEQVQHLLGHQSLDTTLQYAMVNQANVKLSHRKFIG